MQIDLTNEEIDWIVCGLREDIDTITDWEKYILTQQKIINLKLKLQNA